MCIRDCQKCALQPLQALVMSFFPGVAVVLNIVLMVTGTQQPATRMTKMCIRDSPHRGAGYLRGHHRRSHHLPGLLHLLSLIHISLMPKVSSMVIRVAGCWVPVTISTMFSTTATPGKKDITSACSG